MRFLALASDYDGTLAHHGRVSEQTLAALERVRASGRKLVLVTGRELPDLLTVFDRLDLFDLAVMENGALLYTPATKSEQVLAEVPPEKFVQELRQRGVQPLSAGRVIVATREPHENTVINTIRDMGLGLQVIFNKGAVMVLPSGVTKATGLAFALTQLRLSPHNVVAVGDGENDHALLSMAECGVAVSNAIAMLQERADVVTAASHGEGVTEIIEQLLASDLQSYASKLTRHHVALGTRSDGAEVTIAPYGHNLLFVGPSQGGKTTMALGLLERLGKNGYQYCLIDPEGDYSDLEGCVCAGDANAPPQVERVLELLESPKQNVVVNLLAIPLADRPGFFATLFPRLQELRVHTGRPHWILIDESHHLMPSSWNPAYLTMPQVTTNLILVTLEPNHLSPAALSAVDIVAAVGEEPEKTIRDYCQSIGQAPPTTEPMALDKGEALVWLRGQVGLPIKIRAPQSEASRRRHQRKYAVGELPPEQSFYFVGPEQKLRLRAQNLSIFVQLAQGIDDDTWLFHLRRGDYSSWFRSHIKDKELAEETAAIEQDPSLSAAQSRAAVQKAIEQRFTAPA